MDDDLAFAMLPLQYPDKLWVSWDKRDVQMGGSSAEGYEASWVFGTSNIEAEAKGAPGLFTLEKKRLRGEFNCCLPLPEVGLGERGHSQTLLRGNDHQLQEGKFWLYIQKDNVHNDW